MYSFLTSSDNNVTSKLCTKLWVALGGVKQDCEILGEENIDHTVCNSKEELINEILFLRDKIHDLLQRIILGNINPEKR